METDLCHLAPSTWERLQIQDVCLRVTSGGTPSRRKPEFFFNGEWPWIKSQELQDGWVNDTEEKITKKAVNSSSTKVLPPETVLIALYGATVGQLGLLRREMTCNQACCAIIVDPQKAHFRFLFYQLLHVRPFLKLLATGAAQQNLSGQLIKSLTFPFPPLPEQHAIAHILGTLDDKIELNRRMNETLEAMARALFKSWFVDFDPVRAKAEGRDTGLPPEISDLFPDEFEDSELGEIPKGWEVKSLDELAKFLNGLALQKYPAENDQEFLPVVKIAQLRSGNTLNSDRASMQVPPDYIVNDGDILFSWSGSLECIVWSGEKGALNQHLFKVTPLGFYPRWLCFYAVHLHLPGFRHIAAGKATTMGHIQRHHISDAKLAVPCRKVLDAINPILSPMFERSSWQRNIESRSLALLRDTLLPKLISGEIRVEEAEKYLEVVET